MLKKDLATVEKEKPDKSSIQIISARQIHFRTKVSSLESLRTEVSKNMETDRSNGMLSLYCKICGQRNPSLHPSNFKLHIATHFNINIHCALCNKVFNSERKFSDHTSQVHGKAYDDSKDNVYLESTKTKTSSMSKKAKSKYLRTFFNKDTGEKVYRCNMCKVENSTKHIMTMHVKKRHTSKVKTV